VNRFITFEGVDGCGKSTQLRQTAAWLRQQGQTVVTTFEPGDTPLGAELRSLLLGGDVVPVAETELLLFLADRAQHVRQVMMPALESGAWVLCDRYSDSTLAYQLAARKLGEGTANLHAMLAFAECGLHPALTLWFDVPVAEAMRRMALRAAAGEKATRLDEEAESFHDRVAAAFTQQHRENRDRVVRIDAVRAIDDVQVQVVDVLTQQFSLPCGKTG